MPRSAFDFMALSRDWLDVRLPIPWAASSPWFIGLCGEVEPFDAKRSGYADGLRALDPAKDGHSVSLVGNHPQSRGWSLLSASGGAGEWAWSVVDSQFGAAQVNRIDVALDFRCSQTRFDRLFNKGRVLCKDAGLRPHPIGEADWGRTLYFNWSRKAQFEKTGNEKAPQFSARLYEKGKEQGQDPEWRRWEVVCRPDKGIQKERFFHLCPNSILGSPTWSRAFLDLMGYSDALKPGRASVERREDLAGEEQRLARRMATLAVMGEQYGSTYEELCGIIGEDEADRLVLSALKSKRVIVQPDGRETNSTRLLRQEAMRIHSSVYSSDVRRREHNAGALRPGNLH